MDLIADLQRALEQKRALDKTYQKYAGTSRNEADRLESLIRDLTDTIPRTEHDATLAALSDMTMPRPLSEWSEEVGPALWWVFPITEAPYVGSPNDSGLTVEVHTVQGVASRGNVGGWPGYHTHWTPIPMAKEPRS